MRQGSSWLALGAALAIAGAPLSAIAATAPATATAPAAAKTQKAGGALRQFTGVVTAIDRSSLTVEKRGKTPQARVFSRHAEMRTTGEIERNVRVTVYYRESGGRAVAHRVVVKPPSGGR